MLHKAAIVLSGIESPEANEDASTVADILAGALACGYVEYQPLAGNVSISPDGPSGNLMFHPSGAASRMKAPRTDYLLEQ